MRNRSRGKRNQPPTGRGKRQRPYSGESRKLRKRSDVLQAQREHPELNVGDAEEEEAWRAIGPLERANPHRRKAGR